VGDFFYCSEVVSVRPDACTIALPNVVFGVPFNISNHSIGYLPTTKNTLCVLNYKLFYYFFTYVVFYAHRYVDTYVISRYIIKNISTKANNL
jgi:hypothetical protein